MKSFAVAVVFAALALPAAGQTVALPAVTVEAHASDLDIDPAVRAPLDAYLLGHATGDPARFREAFHPDAQLWGLRGGTLIRMTAEQYIAGASGSPAADEAQRMRWIESIDVTGDTAVARIVLDYPAVRFTDYMSLLETDGRWVIVNKMFLAEPKSPPQ